MIRPAPHVKLAMVLAAGLALAPFTSAQTVKPADRNAALVYATVFYTGESDLYTKAAEVNMAKVGFDSNKAPEDFKAAAAALAASGGGTIGGLIRASKLDRCDFELPMEQGIGVLMPHLSKMRSAARLLRVDARRHLLDGDAAGAAERIVAMIRMGSHATHDHVLISSLVAVAIVSVAADEAQMQAESGLLTDKARESIATALRGLPQKDPFGVRAAVRGERELFLTWIADAFKGDDAGKQLADAWFRDQAGSENAVSAVRVMNERQLQASVDLLKPYYDQALAAWDAADAPAQLEALGHRMDGGAFGPLGQVLGPALGKAWAGEAKAVGLVEATLAKLASKDQQAK